MYEGFLRTPSGERAARPKRVQTCVREQGMSAAAFGCGWRAWLVSLPHAMYGPLTSMPTKLRTLTCPESVRAHSPAWTSQMEREELTHAATMLWRPRKRTYDTALSSPAQHRTFHVHSTLDCDDLIMAML